MNDPHPPAGICGAKTTSGRPCRKPLGQGTDHVGVGRCRLHGGLSPNAQVSGVTELARREGLMAAMLNPAPVSATDAMLRCLWIAHAEVSYATSRIAELTDDDLVGPVVTTTERPLKEEKGAEDPDHMVTETTTSSPDLHIWMKVRQAAMDRTVTYAKVALAAGIAEREVRLMESQAAQVAAVLHATLRQFGVKDTQEVRTFIRGQLERLAPATIDGHATAVA